MSSSIGSHSTKHTTVKSLLSGHLKIDNTKILMTNGNLMKVESISECSKGSILQYFRPSLRDNWSFKSGRFTQVLLYRQFGALGVLETTSPSEERV